MASDAEKIEELTAIIQTVRDRVRARYPKPEDGTSQRPGIQIPLADLMPVVHARDAAQAKIAAIGSVNPRAGGPVNNIIQVFKKTIARSLQWFVRDQVIFNREAITAIEALLEAVNEQNRALLSMASQTNEQLRLEAETRATEVRPLTGEIVELRDIRTHWIEWRADWERKLAANEIQFLRSVAELQGAFQHRVTLMESGFREAMAARHRDYEGALDRSTLDIQKRLWDDMTKVRGDFERMIHTELRMIRQRGWEAAVLPPVSPAAAPPPRAAWEFDYGRFAERFRGSQDFVRAGVAFYLPFFSGRSCVLDIGCGRGEFLELMESAGVSARGIDLSEESVALCREKGLNAARADLFDYLAAQPDAAFDGIFSSQVAEHIEPEKLPQMIRLCAAKLQRGGVLALETPNPECLAIFASHFYLDPTHTRPVPSPLMSFYMEEAGLGMIEVHPLSPAVESMPELAEVPGGFLERFFGGLDYAIIGRKL